MKLENFSEFLEKNFLMASVWAWDALIEFCLLLPLSIQKDIECVKTPSYCEASVYGIKFRIYYDSSFSDSHFIDIIHSRVIKFFGIKIIRTWSVKIFFSKGSLGKYYISERDQKVLFKVFSRHTESIQLSISRSKK